MVASALTVHLDQGSTGLPRLRFRPSRPGPESQLVQDFLRKLQFTPTQYRNVTIFQEPWLGGGCPDVVLVIWNPAVARRWRPERRKIERDDLRVVHHLVGAGLQTESQLSQSLGLQCHRSLDRLHRAGLISKRGIGWRAKPLPSIFATRAIIAVEAKMSNWKGAIQQALLNTWFASDSYILLPTRTRKENIFAEARAQGVGVLDGAPKLTTWRTSMTPRSYISWELNEWAWQLSLT